MLREFVELVNSQSATLMSDIRQAIATCNATLLRRAAHTLKGTVNYFGAESLVKAALALERHGREESFDGVAATLTTVEKELERFLKALAAGPN